MATATHGTSFRNRAAELLLAYSLIDCGHENRGSSVGAATGSAYRARPLRTSAFPAIVVPKVPLLDKVV